MNLCANCCMGLHSSSAVYSGLRILLAPACHVTPCQKRRKGAGQLPRQKGLSSRHRAESPSRRVTSRASARRGKRATFSVGLPMGGLSKRTNLGSTECHISSLHRPPSSQARTRCISIWPSALPTTKRWISISPSGTVVRRAGSPGYQWAEPRTPES